MQPKPYVYTEWNNCPKCGTKLTTRIDALEGEVPHCSNCESDRFPLFNVACSVIILDPSRTKTLLVKQYGGTKFRLVAGYVSKGEDAEHTVRREIREELGAQVVEMQYNRSGYFGFTNTMLLNFIVVLDRTELQTNPEIDSYEWFELEAAREQIWPGSLIETFYNEYLDQRS